MIRKEKSSIKTASFLMIRLTSTSDLLPLYGCLSHEKSANTAEEIKVREQNTANRMCEDKTLQIESVRTKHYKSQNKI